MLKTYKACLKNDRLEWLETPPPVSDRELLVDVSISLADAEPPAPQKSGARAMAALEELAKMGGLEHIIPDPVAWQREIRKDRVLPGREE